MDGMDVEAVVAGHICVDLIPEIKAGGLRVGDVLTPGKLVDVGPMTSATGGAVANTGGAMLRLGVRTALAGKVGADTLGEAIRGLLRDAGAPTEFIKISQSDATSYSVVINIPGIDRIFLHCPGANDTFEADDIPFERLEGAKLLHFGYPPLMRSVYSDGGRRLSAVFAKAKSMGMATSLDMARPDPASDAGKVDWPAYLGAVLPLVDVFLPSVDELLFMFDKSRFTEFEAELHSGKPLGGLSLMEVDALAGRMISLGAAMVGMKLGSFGFFLKTSSAPARLAPLSGILGGGANAWLGKSIHSPCYQASLVSGLGAGDCTIAGLLSAILKGHGPEKSVDLAVAVGAFNVERPDALSGVPTWDALEARIASGWEKRQSIF